LSRRPGRLFTGSYINLQVPAELASFQGDFDFSASKGFILRVSAGVDAFSHVVTWLLQAIDPDTGPNRRGAARSRARAAGSLERHRVGPDGRAPAPTREMGSGLHNCNSQSLQPFPHRRLPRRHRLERRKTVAGS